MVHKPSLSDLPKLFSINGKNCINYELIKKIIQIEQGPSKKIKLLLKQLNYEKTSKSDDMSMVLASKIIDGKFRKSWNELCETNPRRCAIIPFNSLVAKYITNHNVNFEIDSTYFSELFDVINYKDYKKYYPKANKINILVERALQDENVGILFLWSLIDNAEYAVLRGTNDERLVHFKEAIIQELNEQKAINAIKLLSPNEWQSEDDSSQQKTENDNNKITLELFEEKEHVRILVNPLGSTFDNFRKELNESYQNINNYIKVITVKTNTILSSSNNDKNIEKISNQLSLLQDALTRINTSQEIFQKEISHYLNYHLAYLRYKTGIVTPKFDNINAIPDLILEINDLEKNSIKTFISLTEIAKSSYVKEIYGDSAVKSLFSIKEIEQICETAVVRINQYEKGIVSLSKITVEINEKKVDLEWNPISLKESVNHDFLNIFFYKKSQKEIDNLLSIVSSKLGEVIAEDLSELIENNISELNIKNLDKAISLINYLPINTSDILASKNNALKPIICLAHIHLILQPKVSLENKHLLLNSKSLLEFKSNTNKPLSIFINELSNAVSSSVFKNGYSFLIRKMSNLVTEEKTVDLKSKYLTELTHILTFYKKGGQTTYAHIWSEAYKDLFEPLLTLIHKKDLNNFVFYFQDMVNNLDLDSKLSIWKVRIPEHLKKNSEYNKNIKNSVRSKIDEIKNYIEDNNNFIVENKKDNFSGIINNLLSEPSADSKYFHFWLNNLDNFEKSISNYAILRSLSGDSVALSSDKVPAQFVRSFIKSIKGECISNDDLLYDTLINTIENNTPTSIAKKYLHHDMLEGYTKLLTEIESDEIELEVERTIERIIEEKNDYFRKIISNIQLSISELSDLDSELYSGELKGIEDLFEQQRWYDLNHASNDLITLIESFKKDEIERIRAEKLKNRISTLTGHNISSYDLNKLETEHARLMNSLEGNMLHISQLMRLKIPQINGTRLSKLIDECIQYFYKKIPYPKEQQAQMISFSWQQAIEPLTAELSRSDTLLPSYSKKLKLLAENFVSSLVDSDSLEENSKFLEMIFDTSEIWASLPSNGEKGIDIIYSAFSDNGFKDFLKCSEEEEGIIKHDEHQNKPISTDLIGLNTIEKSTEKLLRIRSSLVSLIRSSTKESLVILNDGALVNVIKDNNWNVVLNSAPSVGATNEIENDISNIYIIAWCYAWFMSKKPSLELNHQAYLCHLLNIEKGFAEASKIKTFISDFLLNFFKKLCSKFESDSKIPKISVENFSDAFVYMYTNIQEVARFEDEFTFAFMSGENSPPYTLKVLWEYFSGDPKQAEMRAYFMYICWSLHAKSVLTKCLTFPPIDLDPRKALALAEISDKALTEKNNDLLQPLYDLKSTVTSKPYTLFVDLLRKVAPVYSEYSASFELIGSLELINSTFAKGRVCITPRKNDAPDILIITLPPKGPLRFVGHKLRREFLGPFLVERIIPIEFEILIENLEDFNIEIDIESTSITGIKNSYSKKLNVRLVNVSSYNQISFDEIEEAFDNFPEQQMRGNEYVPRIEDEKKIEKALITSKSLRSLWITSPRRSGKTTMLYRILDSYSHKVGRDIIIIYLTLDDKPKSTTDFNKWIWKRLRAIQANKELRSLYNDFNEIGKDIDFDNDVGTFMSLLADLLIQYAEKALSINRVIYMLDEVDKFASMHFSSAEQMDTVNSILWQIRNMTSNSRNVGVVFAGSTAAKEIFISNPVSPFYNSIEHIELTPFSCKNKESEIASRQIVEPLKIRGKFELSKQSLEHLLWVCAGIPYYMKLLAGSTYSVIKQGKIIESDVNDGLYALLNKKTGIAKLDGMGGAPGTDDLRTTLTLKNSEDGVIARAVLFTLAELYSPVSGHEVLRGKLTSNECKLTYEYKLTKKQINDGIDTCIKLGLIKSKHSDSVSKLIFSIPILGESIRFNSHKFWAEIHTELKEISAYEGEE